MVTFRDLTELDLPTIRPWFDDPETRHWLGGWTWPEGKLALAGPGRHTLLACLDDTPVGLVDIDIGSEQRAAFAIVVAPDLRRSGVGQNIVAALVADERFTEVSEWLAGVERGNIASQRLLIRCGFTRMTDEDPEGFSYFARRRSGWPRLPWQPPWSATRADALPQSGARKRMPTDSVAPR